MCLSWTRGTHEPPSPPDNLLKPPDTGVEVNTRSGTARRCHTGGGRVSL